MGETPNHTYNIPEAGTENWHEPLNDNFAQSDIDIELRGPDAEKEAYEPHSGAKFFATDTGIIYLGDGDAWKPIKLLVDIDEDSVRLSEGSEFVLDGVDLRVQDGDLHVEGTKQFVTTVSTATGTQEISYTAIEAGIPRTEISGITVMKDAEVTITLPSHFAMVTSEHAPLIVQITPYATELVHPQVTDRSLSQIVIEDPSHPGETYEIGYTIKGVRAGYEEADPRA